MNGTLPRVALALGVPDALDAGAAAGGELTLTGNSGIASALAEELRRRDWPHASFLLQEASAVPPDSAVLVNAVCEPALHRGSLRRLAQLQMQSGLPVLNPWWVTADCGRHQVSRRLAYQNGVRAPHCTLFRAGATTLTAHIAARQHSFPVLLRPLGRHGSAGLTRADDAAAVSAQNGFSAGHVTDFVDFKSADGHYRKYRMVYAGDTLFRRHLLIDRQWNLTGEARSYMQHQRPELIAEEKEWMARPLLLVPGSVEARLLHQFRALQLDFGSVDYALLPGDEILLFEINACVQLTGSIPPGLAFDWSYLEAGNPPILEALLNQLVRRAGQRANSPAAARSRP